MRSAPAFLLLFAIGLSACGDDSDTPDASATTVPTDTTESPDGDGEGGSEGDATIAVRMEETEGIFIEGFEVGLRFVDAATGTEIDRVLWTEFVASLDSTELDAFYDSVLEQPVPAGTIRVGVDVNVGIGPGPQPPDLDAAAMPCELEVEVAAGATITVEVAFDDAADECLRVVDG